MSIKLNDLGDTALLTPEAQSELAFAVQAGCEQSKDRMIKANLRLVVSMARTVRRPIHVVRDVKHSNYASSLPEWGALKKH